MAGSYYTNSDDDLSVLPECFSVWVTYPIVCKESVYLSFPWMQFSLGDVAALQSSAWSPSVCVSGLRTGLTGDRARPCSFALGCQCRTCRLIELSPSLAIQIGSPHHLHTHSHPQKSHALLVTDLTSSFLLPPELSAPTCPSVVHSHWCLVLGSALPGWQQRDPASGDALAHRHCLLLSCPNLWHSQQCTSYHHREDTSPDPPGKWSQR